MTHTLGRGKVVFGRETLLNYSRHLSRTSQSSLWHSPSLPFSILHQSVMSRWIRKIIGWVGFEPMMDSDESDVSPACSGSHVSPKCRPGTKHWFINLFRVSCSSRSQWINAIFRSCASTFHFVIVKMFAIATTWRGEKREPKIALRTPPD